MAKYKLTPKAKLDLTDIWDYTCRSWSENQAEIYYHFLIEGFNAISKNPLLGKDYSILFSNLRGYQVGRHIVFYLIVSEQTIEIIRILHDQMDIKNRITEK